MTLALAHGSSLKDTILTLVFSMILMLNFAIDNSISKPDLIFFFLRLPCSAELGPCVLVVEENLQQDGHIDKDLD